MWLGAVAVLCAMQSREQERLLREGRPGWASSRVRSRSTTAGPSASCPGRSGSDSCVPGPRRRLRRGMRRARGSLGGDGSWGGMVRGPRSIPSAKPLLASTGNRRPIRAGIYGRTGPAVGVEGPRLRTVPRRTCPRPRKQRTPPQGRGRQGRARLAAARDRAGPVPRRPARWPVGWVVANDVPALHDEGRYVARAQALATWMAGSADAAGRADDGGWLAVYDRGIWPPLQSFPDPAGTEALGRRRCAPVRAAPVGPLDRDSCSP